MEMSQKRQKNEKKFSKKIFFSGQKIFGGGGSHSGGSGGVKIQKFKNPLPAFSCYDNFLSEKPTIKVLTAISREEIGFPQNIDPKSQIFKVTPPGEKMSKFTKTFFELNRFAISILLKKISIPTLCDQFPRQGGPLKSHFSIKNAQNHIWTPLAQKL